MQETRRCVIVGAANIKIMQVAKLILLRQTFMPIVMALCDIKNN